MIEQDTSKLTPDSAPILERIAQQILVAYALVSGPGMTEQQRIQQELAKARRMEVELDGTSIAG